MSEYWKSTPKYYCKHCKTFVVDTPVSKKNHDASPKHQGALKRFLRDLHRTTEKEASAAASAKREVARLNALVSGPSPSSSSSAAAAGPTYKPVSTRAATEEERKRHLKELESLGVALPDEARRELAMVGDWETAEVGVGVGVARPEKGGGGAGGGGMSEKEKLQGELKRKFEEEEKERRWNAMDEDERAMRGFRIQMKTYPPKAGERVGGFKPMVFKGKGKAVAAGEVKREEGGGEAPEAAVKKEDKEEADEAPRIKKEETDVEGVDIKAETEEAPAAEVKKEEPENVSDGIVFKKRKVKNIRKKI
ncbi:uncharacterized protein H6S33_007535 [Morchella sextelata]|uniref:uncharacterized protein n=1 Tax=Morchella sextelata TaxID=1174677 RepID=UPI001D04CF7F|nr:uncharacterized protein H6S33_007535 [Morchella sextelata]KAH0603876.1 hypothetical protein H6S33_007535 [Morchella sextelata]